MKSQSNPSKKLTLSKSIVKALTIRTNVRTGGSCGTGETCSVDCYVSCDGGTNTMCPPRKMM